MSQKPLPPSREDWLKAAFRVVSLQGPHALDVETVARQAGADDIAFYAHFKDVAALQDAMIAYWQEVGMEMVEKQLAARGYPPREMLTEFLRMAAVRQSIPDSGAFVEAMIRYWAHIDPSIAKLVKSADARRLRYLEDLLSRCGVAKEKCSFFALLIYSVGLGLKALPVEDTMEREATLIAVMNLAFDSAT